MSSPAARSAFAMTPTPLQRQRTLDRDRRTSRRQRQRHLHLEHGRRAPGTYYFAGYMYNGDGKLHDVASDQADHDHRRAAANVRLTGPTSGSYQAGSTVNIQWTGRQRPRRQHCQPLLRHRHHPATATKPGSKSTTLRPPTAPIVLMEHHQVAPGTYYIAGYM